MQATITTDTRSLPPVSDLLQAERPVWLQPWCAFAAEMQFCDLPGLVVEQTRRVLLDSIGAIAAGMGEPEMRRLVKVMSGEAGASPVIGAGARRSAHAACLLNGAAGTTLELDEGHFHSRGHPGIHVIPALLAAAATAPRPVDGGALLTALALGYDLGARIGSATRLRKTLHPHGTWGGVGAAMAVAKLADATAADLAGAVNMAADLSMASSRRTALEGATVRNLYAGAANQMGLLAWQMQQAGFTAEADAVATVFGEVSGESFDAPAMTDQLGTRWEITHNYFKRHAACRYLHGALDCLDRIRTTSGPLIADDVAAVEVWGYAMMAQLDNPRPYTTLAAKFSLPFALASSLMHGSASVLAFQAAAIENAGVRGLAERVQVRENAAFTNAFPAQRRARVVLTMTDGRKLAAETVFNRGDAEDPYRADEVAEKFAALAGPVWAGDGPARIAALVVALDQGRDATPLLDALAHLPLR